MRIQNIDMAVPVGRDTPDAGAGADEAEKELACDEAALNSLIQATADAVKRRTGFAWSKQSRLAQRAQFERELKGIIKKLASNAATIVSERNGRNEVRVRMYSDLLAVVTAVLENVNNRADRVRVLKKWAWTVGLFVLAASALTLSILQYA